MRLAILTPRIDGREEKWRLCRDSVVADAPSIPHLILSPEDNKSTTAGQAMNQLCAQAVSYGFTHFFQVSDDDYLLPGWYDALMAPFAKRPDLEVVTSDVLVCNEAGEITTRWHAHAKIDRIWNDSIPFHITSLDVWERAGGYPEVPWCSDWLMLAKAHKAQPVSMVKVPGAWYVHRNWQDTESARGGWYCDHTLAPVREELEKIRSA